MNISFLNPSILWALPLALVPLIIHLFFKRNPKNTEFSDLRFIRLALEKLRTKMEMRRYLLLLIRTLVILLLVLSFAKPFFHSGLNTESSGKSERLSAVILLDVSYSSGYYEGSRQRVARYKEMAKKIIALLPPKSRAGIIAYSQKVEAVSPSLSSDKGYLLNMIDGIKLSDRPTDISCAIVPAKEMLDAAPSSNRVMIILSDMAEHGFRVRPAADEEKIRVIYFEPPGGDNAWLKDVSVDYDAAVKTFRLISEALSRGKNSPRSLPVTYYAGDRKIGAEFLAKNGAGAYKGAFDFGDVQAGVLSGKALLAYDRLEADNVFYFVKKRSSDYKIWIVDGDPKYGGVSSESFYLKNLFPKARVISESGIDSAGFSAPGAVILANVRNDNPRISEFLRAGGGLLVFPGSHTSESFRPEYLPAEIGSRFTGPESAKWVAQGHQLQDSVDVSSFDWDKINVEQGFVLMPKDNTSILATLASGRVFFVEGAFGGSRVVLCASSANRDWNNMPSRSLYAPFMTELVRYISGIDYKEERTAYFVGETYRRKAPPGTIIATPDGASVKPPYDGTEIYFSATDKPGIYSVLNGEKTISVFAVNLDPLTGESDLTPITSNALKGYFNNYVLFEAPRENWERYFVSLISGKDITRLLFAAIFLLLLLEVILANPPCATQGAGQGRFMNKISSMRKAVGIILTVLFVAGMPLDSFCQQENKFVFTQAKYLGSWDPYPETWQDIVQFLVVTTSVKCEPERRVVTLDDKLLFSSPFLVILGTGNFPPLKKNERDALRRFMSRGGLVFVEDSSGIRGGAFDSSFRREAAALFPETDLKKLPPEHPLYRAYYFIRKVGGRRLTNNYIEGINVSGRTALIYSQNDLIGAWAKDRFGNYLWECVPGKAQRFEAQKLTINLIMYGVTGTYKSDAIHKPYLEMKR